MRKIVVIALLVLFSLPTFSQLKSATLVASGLTCSMCSKAIYKALEKVSYIDKVDVNIETSSYNVTFREGSEVELDEMKKAVEDAGFFVASLKVTIVFDKVNITNDTHVTIGGTTFHFVNVTKQVLDGMKQVTVIDKNFLPAKERKKYSKYTQMKCFETGVTEACCPPNKGRSNRIYNVTL